MFMLGKQGRRTPVSLVYGEIQVKTFAKRYRRDGARIPFPVSEMSTLKARSQCNPQPLWA